mgnify:CR=1 FL=1
MKKNTKDNYNNQGHKKSKIQTKNKENFDINETFLANHDIRLLT